MPLCNIPMVLKVLENKEHCMDQIEVASQMAGAWWAERLDPAYARQREVFAAAVAKRCERALRKHGSCRLEVDYDPRGIMLSAVRETINPHCRGMMFSADGVLPRKHELEVLPTALHPKEGYGNWTAVIPVPVVHRSLEAL